MGKRKLAAIAFVDIVDFSRQVSEDEASALTRRDETLTLVRQAVAAHSGRVVKTLGDGAMLEFGSTVAAVRCALQIQEQMPDPGREVELRIGIHVGDVQESEDDLHGNAVNIAARLEKAASPGGVCVSREVMVQVRSALAVSFFPIYAEERHNLPEPVEMFSLGAREGRSNLTAAPQTIPASTALPQTNEAQDGLQWAEAMVAQLRHRRLISAGVFALCGLMCFVAAVLSRAWLTWSGLSYTLLIGSLASLAAGVLIVLVGARSDAQSLQLGKRLKGTSEESKAYCDRISRIPTYHAAVQEPLRRAVAAHGSIAGLLTRPVWSRAGIDVQTYLAQSDSRIRSILDWGEDLCAVTIPSSAAPSSTSSWEEATKLFDTQCARLTDAAEVFERANAALARAALAAAGRNPNSTSLVESIQEMTSTFDALTEILADERSAVPLPEPVLLRQLGQK